MHEPSKDISRVPPSSENPQTFGKRSSTTNLFFHEAQEIEEQNLERLQEVEDIAAEIQQICWPGCSDSVLKTTLAQLRALKESLQVLQDSAERTQTSAIGDHTTVSQLTVEEIAQHPDN